MCKLRSQLERPTGQAAGVGVVAALHLALPLVARLVGPEFEAGVAGRACGVAHPLLQTDARFAAIRGQFAIMLLAGAVHRGVPVVAAAEAANTNVC